jgi:hypothetical protein
MLSASEAKFNIAVTFPIFDAALCVDMNMKIFLYLQKY